jgi:hypothetical protein
LCCFFFFENKREKRSEKKKTGKGRQAREGELRGWGWINGRVAYLDEDFLEARVHAFLVQLVAVERQALDKLFHRALRFERKERQAERDVAPLPRVLGEAEALAELLDDALRLFFLFFMLFFRVRVSGV